MSGMMTIGEALAQMQSDLQERSGRRQLIANWKDTLPAGSLWMPGDVGQPACQHCLGKGYLRLDVSVGHKFFGKLFACECQSGRVAERLQRESELTIRDRSITWDDVVITPGLRTGYDAVRATLRRGHGWVYLYGGPGPGKTLLIKAAVAEWVKKGQSGVFVLWADMLDHIRRGFDAGDFDKRIEQWRNIPLLAIDEYGRANNTGWVNEVRTRILVPRDNRAIQGQSITLFTSNYAPDRVDNDDSGWFYDRLRDGRYDALDRDNGQGGIVEVTGESMRPSMRYTDDEIEPEF